MSSSLPYELLHTHSVFTQTQAARQDYLNQLADALDTLPIDFTTFRIAARCLTITGLDQKKAAESAHIRFKGMSSQIVGLMPPDYTPEEIERFVDTVVIMLKHPPTES